MPGCSSGQTGLELDWNWTVYSRCLQEEAEQAYVVQRVYNMLHIFYQSVVATVIFYSAICLDGSITAWRLIETEPSDREGSVLGSAPGPVALVGERRDNTTHPLHNVSHSRRASVIASSSTCRTQRGGPPLRGHAQRTFYL